MVPTSLVEIQPRELYVVLSQCKDTMGDLTQGQLTVDLDMDSLPKCQTMAFGKVPTEIDRNSTREAVCRVVTCTDTTGIETQDQLLVDMDIGSLPKCQNKAFCKVPTSLIEILPMELYVELPQRSNTA